MDKGHFAEGVLTLLCGRQRASEIVGDLLEQQNAGSASFWWMLFRVVFAMSWRWPVAIITAAMSILFALVKYVAFFQGNQSLRGGMSPLSWGVECMLACACVWSVVVLNTFRFGFRNYINSAGIGMTVLLAVMACLELYPWVPWVMSIAPVAVLAYAGLCLSRRSLRAPFCCVVASAVSYAGAFYVFMHLMSRPPLSPRLLALEFFGYWSLSFILEAWVLSQTRRWFLPSVQNA